MGKKLRKRSANTFLALAGASVASTENSNEPLRVLCTFCKTTRKMGLQKHRMRVLRLYAECYPCKKNARWVDKKIECVRACVRALRSNVD